jgi:predicted site-specific integrase-resolvase
VKVMEFSEATGLSEKTLREWIQKSVISLRTDPSGRPVLDETVYREVDEVILARSARFKNRRK